MFELKDCRVDGSKAIHLDKMPTDAQWDKGIKLEIGEKVEQNTLKLAGLQDRLYADGREGVVVLLQAMDAGGKDSTIKHVMSGVNPQGVTVTSFKRPSSEELAHDYLWRAVKALPCRGNMALFNRSYYEDVLVVRVHKMQERYRMPDRCLDGSDKAFFERRYRQIEGFEDYLYENGYRTVKVFLHISPDEQRRRFLRRIDDEAKNWKLEEADLAERALWNDYMAAYEDAINGTATERNPWYVIPADQKWVARYLVGQAIIDTVEACNPQYPTLPEDQRAQLSVYRQQLESEDDCPR